MSPLLQVDSIEDLKNNPGFWDNYVWPLAVAFTAGLFLLIWNYFFRKKFKIILNYSDSYIAEDNGNDYLVLNLNLVNETSIPINNLTLELEQNYEVLNGIYHTYPGGEFSPGLITLPSVHNRIDNIIFEYPENIEPHSNIIGNLIINIVSRKNKLEQLTFSYLTEKKKLRIMTGKLSIKKL